MKVLITGANGLVGSNVIKELNNKREYELIANSLSNKYIGKEVIQYISANLTSDNFIQEIYSKIESCDVLIHSGALIDYNLFSKEIIMTNCFGIQQIMKLANILKCKKLIFISSVPVIGEPIQIPVTEEHLISPKTAYHASKVFAENMLQIKEKLGFKPIIFRITSPIGANMPKNRMLSIFIENTLKGKDIIIYGKGIRRQNYVDVKDIANAIDLSCKKDVEGIFNIAGEKSYTSLELAEACSTAIGKKSNIKYKDIVLGDEYYNWDISIEKAKKILDYKPQYSLEDSIKEIIKSDY